MPKNIIKDLMARNLPGNVRELENRIHRMVVLQSNNIGLEEDLLVDIPGEGNIESISYIVSKLVEIGSGNLLDAARERIEKPLLARVMSRVGENQSEAAKILGVSRNTLRKMLARYGMAL